MISSKDAHKALKYIRNEKGITQHELAKRLGVTQSWICYVENQRYNVSGMFLSLLHRYMQAIRLPWPPKDSK